MKGPRQELPPPHIRRLIETFVAPESQPVRITREEEMLLNEVEDGFMLLLPCSLAMGRRWHGPTAKLLVLGHDRTGLDSSTVDRCRRLIREAKLPIREAINARSA